MLGPVIGGWLTGNYSWRWVFYINLSVLASIIMTRLFIFAPHIRRASADIDYWASSCWRCRQDLLDKVQEEDWFSSHWMTALAVIAAVALAVFVLHEIRSRDPVVHLRVFKIRT
jgi:DHA2 family multidrug resistance protein